MTHRQSNWRQRAGHVARLTILVTSACMTVAHAQSSATPGMYINVGGPSAVTGGASAWASVSTSDADICTYPASATWYVGAIENSPGSSLAEER